MNRWRTLRTQSNLTQKTKISELILSKLKKLRPKKVRLSRLRWRSFFLKVFTMIKRAQRRSTTLFLISTKPISRFFSILKSVKKVRRDTKRVVLSWNFLTRLFPRQLKTSVFIVQERKEAISTTKETNSTELSRILWCKVETQQRATALAARVFMDTSLTTKVSGYLTHIQESYRWLTQDQTQMVPNFSFVTKKRHILTKNTPFLEGLFITCLSAIKLQRSRLEPTTSRFWTSQSLNVASLLAIRNLMLQAQTS